MQYFYRDKILPRLIEITVPEIAKILRASEPYAAKVRKDQFVPHPMHWQALAQLAEYPHQHSDHFDSYASGSRPASFACHSKYGAL
jgi:hypothetical protein